jgi:hypothetical protein|tara:strand:- start:153 stop:395 length:243 start_codon:yes stop_codon:yes gene_type:complete
MIDEFEIDWIPEDTGAPYEVDMTTTTIELPAHSIDKLCKKKFGHTNWARMGQMSPEDLIGNPHEFDYENGVIFFKNAHMV